MSKKLKIYWEKEKGVFKKTKTKGEGILLSISQFQDWITAFYLNNKGIIKSIEVENIIKTEWINL